VISEPGEAAFDQRLAEVTGHPLVVRPLVGDVAAQRRVARPVELQERQIDHVGPNLVERRQHADRRLLEAGLVLGRRLRHPAAEVVGRQVGRHLALNPLHHEKRRTDRRRVELQPERAGHRHGGPLLHQPHHPELLAQVVGREHRHRRPLGLDAGHARNGPRAVTA